MSYSTKRGEPWIIGKDTAKPCWHCGAEPTMTKAENGRAEVWHTPFTCCKRASDLNAFLRMGDSDHQARREGST